MMKEKIGLTVDGPSTPESDAEDDKMAGYMTPTQREMSKERHELITAMGKKGYLEFSRGDEPGKIILDGEIEGHSLRLNIDTYSNNHYIFIGMVDNKYISEEDAIKIWKKFSPLINIKQEEKSLIKTSEHAMRQEEETRKELKNYTQLGRAIQDILK